MSFFKKNKLRSIISDSTDKLKKTSIDIQNLSDNIKSGKERKIRKRLFYRLIDIRSAIVPICIQLRKMNQQNIILWPEDSIKIMTQNIELATIKSKLDTAKSICDKYIINLQNFSDAASLFDQTIETADKFTNCLMMSEIDYFDKYDENTTDEVDDENKTELHEV